MSNKTNRIALWKNDKKGDNQPVLRGEVEFEDGSTYRVSIWKNDKGKANAPDLTGTLEVPQAKEDW